MRTDATERNDSQGGRDGQKEEEDGGATIPAIMDIACDVQQVNNVTGGKVAQRLQLRRVNEHTLPNM